MPLLGDLVEIKGGGTPSKSVEEYWGGGIPWASVKDFKTIELSKTTDSITKLGVENSATRVVPEGTIIVPTRMALGKVAVTTTPMAINQDLKALLIRDESRIYSRYLLRCIEAKGKEIEKKGKGATVKGISIDVLKALYVPLPEMSEQKRIATILDKADALRRKRQKAIELADQFLRSVFLDMFGDPVGNPKGWPLISLGNAITHANNGLSRRRKTQANEGSVVLRLQDIQYQGIRFTCDLNRIDMDEREKSRYLVGSGDILFVRVNGNPDYVGRSAVFEGYEEAVYHNDHLIRIKTSDDFDPWFLTYLFNSRGGREIISKQVKTSAGQHTISQGGIQQLKVYRTPIELQKKFASILKKVNRMDFGEHEFSRLFEALSNNIFSN